MSDDELEALLDACRASDWDKLFLLASMALGTGARLGELRRLRWNDIDFAERTAILHKTRNGRARLLSLPSPVVVELIKFRGVGSALIFRSKSDPDKRFAFRSHWNKALKKSGIETFRFHDLRHTAASYLAMNGASLLEIADAVVRILALKKPECRLIIWIHYGRLLNWVDHHSKTQKKPCQVNGKQFCLKPNEIVVLSQRSFTHYT